MRLVANLATWATVFTVVTAARGQEIAVTWTESRTGGIVNENKLPAGAMVKIRVVEVETLSGLDFTVNGEKFTARKAGDEFRVKVNNDGTVLVSGVFGKMLVGKIFTPPRLMLGGNLEGTRYSLQLVVRVSD